MFGKAFDFEQFVPSAFDYCWAYLSSKVSYGPKCFVLTMTISLYAEGCHLLAPVTGALKGAF
jgi:hypothetical protein